MESKGGIGMKSKKYLLMGLLVCSVLGLATHVSFAEETKATLETLETVSSESNAKTKETAKELDITPTFKLEKIKTTVGGKGLIEVEPLEGLKDLKGTFKVTVADTNILTVDKQGNWQGLKAGTTTAVLDFEWSEESLAKIQKKFPDTQLNQKSIAQEIPVEVTQADEKFVDITPEYNLKEIKAKIGETGQFSVKPMGGVSDLKGIFTARISSGQAKDVLSVDADGKWTALKAGKTEFVLDYKLSDESYKEIQDKNPGSTLTSMSIATLIKVEVTPVGSLNITPVIDATSVEGKVGDTGQLNVKPIEGVEGSKGAFAFTVKDPSIIEIDANGNWKALKAGTTEFTYTYTWSDETMKLLSEKYPGYEFYTQDNAQVLKVTITDNTTGSTVSGGTAKPVGKQLPATNETNSNGVLLAGFIVVLFAVVGFYRKTETV
jgi:LPXTG-motif cell wall-anchored protein